VVNKTTLSKLNKLLRICNSNTYPVNGDYRVIGDYIKYANQHGNITADMMRECNELYKKYKVDILCSELKNVTDYERYKRSSIDFATEYLCDWSNDFHIDCHYTIES